jgi:site-specific DNA-methyltransferase (adenine-specific)
VIHDGSDEVVDLFPNCKGGVWNTTKGARHFNNDGKDTEYQNKGKDTSIGSAARFFYCAKASKKEKGQFNKHPTVKPLKLIEYLVKLITPLNGIVMDPFLGSGTTAIVCKSLDVKFVGIEKEKEYLEIAEKRLESCII